MTGVTLTWLGQAGFLLRADGVATVSRLDLAVAVLVPKRLRPFHYLPPH